MLTDLILTLALGYDQPIDTKQATCIAEAVYFEASGESIQGKAAVAQTIVNRSVATNRTPCEVVNRPYQFSYTLLPDEELARRLSTDDHPSSIARFESATIALAAVTGSLAIHKAKHYYNPSKASPKWAKAFDNALVIGDHRFVW